MPTKKDQRQAGGAPAQQTVWGAYIPDIMRSYPDPPVRGRVVHGKHGPEFRPDDPGKARHGTDRRLDHWLTGQSYDMVVQKMRETADEAIKELRAGIARLERFIDNN